MAPEQWEDDPEDERTDVFALGVMLYRTLTGEYPFPEGKGKWSAEPATVRKLDVPGAPELAELVEKMLDRTPKGRPRDGAAVLAALTPIEERLRAKPADGTPPVHAKRRKATFGDLLAELRRRHVFRVMMGYGVFAFAVLQVTEPIMHGAHLPDWVLKAVLVALVLGFPVAVILAWVYDLTAQGVKRTPSATDPGAPLPAGPGSSCRSRSAAVLAIAAAGAGAWYAWKRSPGAGTGKAGPRCLPGPWDGRISWPSPTSRTTRGTRSWTASPVLLVTSLEQSKALRVITAGPGVACAARSGRLGADRRGAGARRVRGRRPALLLASIRRLGGVYAVDLRAVDPAATSTSSPCASKRRARRECSTSWTGSPPGRAPELKEARGEIEASRVPRGRGAVTSNLEANAHFFRAQHLDGENLDSDIAREEYRRALALDPDFAARPSATRPARGPWRGRPQRPPTVKAPSGNRPPAA